MVVQTDPVPKRPTPIPPSPFPTGHASVPRTERLPASDEDEESVPLADQSLLSTFRTTTGEIQRQLDDDGSSSALPIPASSPPKWAFPVLGLLGIGVLVLGYNIYRVLASPLPGLAQTSAIAPPAAASPPPASPRTAPIATQPIRAEEESPAKSTEEKPSDKPKDSVPKEPPVDRLRGISKRDIASAAKELQPEVQECAERFQVRGNVTARIGLGTSGEIGRATVTGQFANTPVGDCLERVIMSARLPSCEGTNACDLATFTMAFKLRPTSEKGSETVVTAQPPTSAPDPEATKPTRGQRGEKSIDDILAQFPSKKGTEEGEAPPYPPQLPSIRLITLGQSDIVDAMKRVQPKIQACANRFKVPGTAMANISVAKGGRVGTVLVTGKFADTATGSCVEEAAKSAKFPPCQPMNFPWPFTLSPR
jgi:hypothetical protein